MRICTKCLIAKPETDYFIKDKTSGRLHAQCKACYKLLRQKTYAKHYEKYKEEYRHRAKVRRESLKTIYRSNMLAFLANERCALCGESDIRVLEFDHLDPLAKEFTISQAVRLNRSWDEVLREIKKCRILCANCHKKHTASQMGWYKAV